MASGHSSRVESKYLTDGVRLVEVLGIDGGGRYILGDCGREDGVICVDPQEIGRTWLSPQEWSQRKDEAADQR